MAEQKLNEDATLDPHSLAHVLTELADWAGTLEGASGTGPVSDGEISGQLLESGYGPTAISQVLRVWKAAEPGASLPGDAYRIYLVRQEEHARHRLALTARRIEKDMALLAKRLERGPSMVNDLGELQSQASSLNAYCGSYEAVRQSLAAFDKARA